eukprot:tig00020610_g11974.t1
MARSLSASAPDLWVASRLHASLVIGLDVEASDSPSSAASQAARRAEILRRLDDLQARAQVEERNRSDRDSPQEPQTRRAISSSAQPAPDEPAVDPEPALRPPSATPEPRPPSSSSLDPSSSGERGEPSSSALQEAPQDDAFAWEPPPAHQQQVSRSSEPAAAADVEFSLDPDRMPAPADEHDQPAPADERDQPAPAEEHEQPAPADEPDQPPSAMQLDSNLEEGLSELFAEARNAVASAAAAESSGSPLRNAAVASPAPEIDAPAAPASPDHRAAAAPVAMAVDAAAADPEALAIDAYAPAAERSSSSFVFPCALHHDGTAVWSQVGGVLLDPCFFPLPLAALPAEKFMPPPRCGPANHERLVEISRDVVRHHPMRAFRTFRFHPYYRQAGLRVSSASLCVRLQRDVALCPQEPCPDPFCALQHVAPQDGELLEDLAAQGEALSAVTPAEKLAKQLRVKVSSYKKLCRKSNIEAVARRLVEDVARRLPASSLALPGLVLAEECCPARQGELLEGDAAPGHGRGQEEEGPGEALASSSFSSGSSDEDEDEGEGPRLISGSKSRRRGRGAEPPPRGKASGSPALDARRPESWVLHIQRTGRSVAEGRHPASSLDLLCEKVLWSSLALIAPGRRSPCPRYAVWAALCDCARTPEAKLAALARALSAADGMPGECALDLVLRAAALRCAAGRPEEAAEGLAAALREQGPADAPELPPEWAAGAALGPAEAAVAWLVRLHVVGWRDFPSATLVRVGHPGQQQPLLSDWGALPPLDPEAVRRLVDMHEAALQDIASRLRASSCSSSGGSGSGSRTPEGAWRISWLPACLSYARLLRAARSPECAAAVVQGALRTAPGSVELWLEYAACEAVRAPLFRPLRRRPFASTDAVWLEQARAEGGADGGGGGGRERAIGVLLEGSSALPPARQLVALYAAAVWALLGDRDGDGDGDGDDEGAPGGPARPRASGDLEVALRVLGIAARAMAGHKTREGDADEGQGVGETRELFRALLPDLAGAGERAAGPALEERAALAHWGWACYALFAALFGCDEEARGAARAAAAASASASSSTASTSSLYHERQRYLLAALRPSPTHLSEALGTAIRRASRLRQDSPLSFGDHGLGGPSGARQKPNAGALQPWAREVLHEAGAVAEARLEAPAARAVSEFARRCCASHRARSPAPHAALRLHAA